MKISALQVLALPHLFVRCKCVREPQRFPFLCAQRAFSQKSCPKLGAHTATLTHTHTHRHKEATRILRALFSAFLAGAHLRNLGLRLRLPLPLPLRLVLVLAVVLVLGTWNLRPEDAAPVQRSPPSSFCDFWAPVRGAVCAFDCIFAKCSGRLAGEKKETGTSVGLM